MAKLAIVAHIRKLRQGIMKFVNKGKKEGRGRKANRKVGGRKESRNEKEREKRNSRQVVLNHRQI
jgi:hypothetical protein